MLSERQLTLLTSIIQEYLDTAEPVGSIGIVKKHSIKCSPATVRNEMAKLIDLGYLQMVHTSSGRVPTRMAYRLYLDEIMHEEEIPVLQEVAMKQRLWPTRYTLEKLLREAAVALADATKLLALTSTDDGYISHAGAVNVLDNKEFWEIDVAKTALMLLDNSEMLEKIFQKAPFGQDVRCVIGDEIDIQNMDRCSVVFAEYNLQNKKGSVAVLGPSRMHYENVIPAVRYTKQLIEELGGVW